MQTLPKFGTLYTEQAQRILPLDGHQQWRDDCYGTDTTGLNGVDSAATYRHCAHRAGVGVPKGTRQRGDLAQRVVVRGASSVVYVPNAGFTGE